ncbi:prepilin peptidase [Candidatus Woesearchaeota archaeon]|nr:MAG: prepilin peptidase [Candidatus Woesearchaeota archaeon]
MQFIIHALALLALFISTITDLRTREVPDWISYGTIFTGIFIGVVKTILEASWHPLLTMVAGLSLGFLLGTIMFYTGQWGGGDSKLLIGLGSLLGLNIFNLRESFLIGFLLNILITGALYGLIWILLLAIKHKREFIKTYKALSKEPTMLFLRKIHLATVLLGLVLAFFTPRPLNSFLFTATVLIYLLFHLWKLVKSVEQTAMIKKIPPSKLTEGDWVLKDVYYHGEYLCGPKDLGISKEQIALLKKHRITSVWVKEGIPFVPSFLFAYLLTLITGNWLALIL